MTSFRKCHILKPQNSSPNQDSNPNSSTGGRLGKQMCPHMSLVSPLLLKFLKSIGITAFEAVGHLCLKFVCICVQACKGVCIYVSCVFDVCVCVCLSVSV